MYFNNVILLSDGGALLNSVPVNDFTFVLVSLSCSDVPPHDECLFVVMFLYQICFMKLRCYTKDLTRDVVT